MNTKTFSGGDHRQSSGRMTAGWTVCHLVISGRNFSFARGSPSRLLAPLISGFWELKGDLAGACDRILPSADVALVLNLGDPQFVEDGNQRHRWSNAWIAGPRLTPITTVSPDRTWICGVRLTHRGSFVLGVAPHSLVGALVALDQVRSTATTLIEQARSCATAGDRFELLARSIWKWAEDSPEWSDTAAYAIRALGQSHGTIRIEDLASDIGWSRQRLHGTMLDFIGIAPKSAARLFRFRRAIDLMTSAETVRLPEIAADAGYFDQAHFIRDFMNFAGMTPGTFLRFRTPGERGFSLSAPRSGATGALRG